VLKFHHDGQELLVLLWPFVLVFLVLLALFAPLPAEASPYFRPIGPGNAQLISGSWVDPAGEDAPDLGGLVPLITHSTRDGALIRAIQADWSPLALGAGRSASAGAFVAVGPVANMAPAVKSALLAGLDLVGPDRFTNLRQLLAPVPDSSGLDVSVSFGPAWLIKPVDGGEFKDPKSWRGHFRLFFGAGLRF
jgi:hypothetical protein